MTTENASPSASAAYAAITTRTGYLMPQVITELDALLPADAYSAIPGGADLTDIDPAHMRRVLNKLFGLCGFGWGVDYNPEDILLSQRTQKTSTGTREVVTATLTRLTFWYTLAVDGEIVRCLVPSTGASENPNAGFAMSGSVTNALGKAVSNLGFQESVYLGKRSHKTVKAGAATTSRTPPIPTTPKSAPAAADLEGYIIPLGKRAGQALGDQDDKVLDWYAKNLTDKGTEVLRANATALLARRHPAAAPKAAAPAGKEAIEEI